MHRLTWTRPTGRKICHADSCLSTSLSSKLPFVHPLTITTSKGDNRLSICSWGRPSSITSQHNLYSLTNRTNRLRANNLSLERAYDLSWGESIGLLLNYLPFNQWRRVWENISGRTFERTPHSSRKDGRRCYWMTRLNHWVKIYPTLIKKVEDI